VRDFLQHIFDQGDIYFGEYSGLYCVGCERFLTDKELVDGLCPDHKTAPQEVREKNYFFRMSKYQDALLKHIDAQPDFIRPERYRNEVLAMLREPLEDLCISRPKARLTWGIELPFDANYVTYVWFDALINYLTGLDYPDDPKFKKFWSCAEHVIAKDIVKPHGVFWPTMLIAAGLPLYRHLNVHGYWVTPTGKMSKSVGNVVNPIEIKNEYGMDVFRHFVFREMAFGLDCTFSTEALEARYNADLANNLWNLVISSLAMVHRYRDGVVPKLEKEGELDAELHKLAEQTVTDVVGYVDRMEIHRALEAIWSLIAAGNVYVDRTKPWTLAKEESTDPAKHSELDAVLYCQLELLRIVAGLLTAFLPTTSERILTFLGYRGKSLAEQQTYAATKSWGGLKAGTTVEKGEVLFPRRDKKEIENSTQGEKKKMEGTAAAQAQPPTPAAESGLISYDEFSKVVLQVGQIMSAERVEKSEKLLRLQVDVGEAGGARQIVAGIGKFYTPEELVGRKVAAVTNLKPAKLMGIVSNGMLLAASDDLGNLELVSVGAAMKPGSKIK
jgi:methionyl-tRNA synthetase